MWNFDVPAKDKEVVYFVSLSLTSLFLQMPVTVCVSVFVSSQGSGLWESIAAGYPAVSASLLSDPGSFEASLWSSVQPHYVWAAKGTRVHKHFSCRQLHMLMCHHCSIHPHAFLNVILFLAKNPVFNVSAPLIAHSGTFCCFCRSFKSRWREQVLRM